MVQKRPKHPYVIDEQPCKNKFKIYNFVRIVNFLLGVHIQIPETLLGAGEEYGSPSFYQNTKLMFVIPELS